MAITAKMVASEILICGVKAGFRQIPIVGEVAVSVVDGLQRRYEASSNSAELAKFEAQLSRVERNMRDTVEREIRTILANLGRPGVPGPELTREMTELRQIYEQGWVPNLFEGLLRNSTHLEELRKSPTAYGRILGDHEPVNPENGMHLLLEKDKARILEMPAASLALLLGNQPKGVPGAEVCAGQDVWAFAAEDSAPLQTTAMNHSPGGNQVRPTTDDDLIGALVGAWSVASRPRLTSEPNWFEKWVRLEEIVFFKDLRYQMVMYGDILQTREVGTWKYLDEKLHLILEWEYKPLFRSPRRTREECLLDVLDMTNKRLRLCHGTDIYVLKKIR
jgi:hypothetical protein